ncbi:hypothetical protein ACFSKN_08585 [Mariniflexile gromovii]|uniref:Lipoprotein n=1 Tax=Mariniflexile gromovii TaxID=362523 RepID=A0ABS4BUN2_9FLAO|nr:hypothetical protein [Mariniflexile gromovii]MBP0904093.1 hypothetical protein [Mariniflexile gromovii]
MKNHIILFINIVLLFGCKKPISEPRQISTDIDSVTIHVNNIQKQDAKEIVEDTTRNEITETLKNIELSINDRIEITTEKQLKAVLAFKNFLLAKEGKLDLDRLNNVLFFDINNDGIEEVIFEYSIILFPGTNTWGLNFLIGNIKDTKIAPIINANIGGKNWRQIWFKSIDNEGLFWFETLSYDDDDAMCCPSIKGTATYRIINNTFNEIKN